VNGVDRLDAPGLRERKKALTRRAIQEQALRLFLAKGYDAATVEEIAAAAGVSHMTVFRYFPHKEDLVLADDYDPLIVALIAARPASEPAADTIRRALTAGLTHLHAADRAALLTRLRLAVRTPALRARLWEQQLSAERLIAQALAHATGDDGADLRLRVVIAACLAAATTVIMAWAEQDGAGDLPTMVDRAFADLRDALSVTGG